jgi:hypothetical protein
MTAVSVTAEHIARGVREDCEKCPVALAIFDAFPDLTYISVGPENILMQFGPEAEIRLGVPSEVLTFIWDYDDDGQVDPFTFTVDYPAVTP